MASTASALDACLERTLDQHDQVLTGGTATHYHLILFDSRQFSQCEQLVDRGFGTLIKSRRAPKKPLCEDAIGGATFFKFCRQSDRILACRYVCGMLEDKDSKHPAGRAGSGCGGLLVFGAQTDGVQSQCWRGAPSWLQLLFAFRPRCRGADLRPRRRA